MPTANTFIYMVGQNSDNFEVYNFCMTLEAFYILVCFGVYKENE